MSKRSKPVKKSRRDFLLQGAAVAGGAATLALVGRTGASEPQTHAVERNASKPASKGYHVTPHIQEYYDKARF